MQNDSPENGRKNDMAEPANGETHNDIEID